MTADVEAGGSGGFDDQRVEIPADQRLGVADGSFLVRRATTANTKVTVVRRR